MIILEIDLFKVDRIKILQQVFDTVKGLVHILKRGLCLAFGDDDMFGIEGELFIEFDV